MTTQRQTIADAAQVLIEHPSIPSGTPTHPDGYRCPSCPDAPIAGPNSPSHAHHQAQALADAGLFCPGVVHLEAVGLSRVHIERTQGQAPRVRIERHGIPILDGYVGPDPRIPQAQYAAPAPARKPDAVRWPQDTRAPLQDRLRALSNDLRAQAPFTAGILWQFADDAEQLALAGVPYDLDEISENLTATIAVHAERERRVKALADTLDGEATELHAAGGEHDAEITRNIVRLLRIALDGKPTPTPTADQ